MEEARKGSTWQKDGTWEELGGKKSIAESFTSDVCGGGRDWQREKEAFDISVTPSPIFKSKTNKIFMWNLNMTVSLTMKAKAHPVAFSPGVSLWWIWPYGIAKQKSILHWELFWNSNAKKQESEQFSPFPSPSPSLTPKVTQEVGTKHNLRHVKHKVCPMFQKKRHFRGKYSKMRKASQSSVFSSFT